MSTTVFNESSTLAGTDDGGGDGIILFRQLLAPGLLSAASGNQAKLTLLFGTGNVGGTGTDATIGGVGIIGVYIGQAAASGNAYNFAGDQVQVTFGGEEYIPTIPAGASTVVSDTVTLAQNWDNTKTYIVSFMIGDGGASGGFSLAQATSLTGATTYYQTGQGSNTTGVTAPTGTFNELTTTLNLFEEIQIAATTVALPAATSIVTGSPTLGTTAIAFPLQFTSVVPNYGLNAFSLANQIVICSPVPATYAEVSGYQIGNMSFGVGNCFGAPSYTSNIGSVTSVAVVGGAVTANGTPLCWAVIDDANSRLLCTGPLTGAVAVTSGQGWTLGSFEINLPGH